MFLTDASEVYAHSVTSKERLALTEKTEKRQQEQI